MEHELRQRQNMLNIFQFSKDPSQVDLSGIPFYQMGFGPQNLPSGKQVHDYVASVNNLKAKESSFLGARANNPATSFIGSQLNSQQNYPFSMNDPTNMLSKLAEDGSPQRKRFNYNDYMQGIEQKISEAHQRQSSYVPRVPPTDPFAMGRSPGAAIYDQIESQNRKNVEFKDKVLARLGNIDDSNDNGSAGHAALIGEAGTDGEGGLEDVDDIDVHMNGFEEGLEGTSEDEEGAMMDGGQHSEEGPGQVKKVLAVP